MPRSLSLSRRGGWLPVTAALLLLLLAAPAAAGPEGEAALFYEALAPHGKWLLYADYGPVWFPTGVPAEWRPYVDGRWVPTPMGWVFETGEPWGWATYHYGHWLPTLDFGWVWVPGRTWYPATVVWRSSRDYIGWAPMPPPFFTPAPAFGGGAFLIGSDPFAVLTPFFWILCPVTHFLRGFGTFWAPAHSFSRCGCLVPLSGVTVLLPHTALVTHFFALRSRPEGCFAFGPEFRFLSQVTAVPEAEFQRVAQSFTPARVQQLTPPAALLEQHSHLREVVPEALIQGRPLPVEPVTDTRQAAAAFLKADAAPRLTRLPTLPPDLPRAVTVPFASRVGPEALKGVKGAELPAAAVNPRLAPPPAPTPGPSPPPAAEAPGETAAPVRQAPPLRREGPPGPREAPEVRREMVAPRGTAPESGREPEVRRRPRMIEVPPVTPAPRGEPAPPPRPPAAAVTPEVRPPAPPPPSVAPPRPEGVPERQKAPPPVRREATPERLEERVREQWERQLRRELERQGRAVPPAAPPAVRERPKPRPAPLKPAPAEPPPPPGAPGGPPPGWPPQPGQGR
jgi:hypothetical protein